ncbi:MAG: helix-turn-helix transcriptional regulator [Nitrospirae bacterium]|nr:helix-turn-helix transcriptional regulator [Nitrospirota bacterium]
MEADYRKSLGRKIEKLRQRRKMTTEGLAWASDLSKSYLGRVQRGERLPSVDVLAKLAKVLGCKVREFFDF